VLTATRPSVREPTVQFRSALLPSALTQEPTLLIAPLDAIPAATRGIDRGELNRYVSPRRRYILLDEWSDGRDDWHSSVQLTAPGTSGAYPGVLFYQDPSDTNGPFSAATVRVSTTVYCISRLRRSPFMGTITASRWQWLSPTPWHFLAILR